MPAKSKSQQRLFGMVHAYQKGELKGASDEVKDIAKSISKKDAEDFAETKHKGLPNKVKKTKTNENMKKSTIKLSESTLRQIIAESVKKILKESANNFVPLISEDIETLKRMYEKWQYAKYKPEGIDGFIDTILEAKSILEKMLPETPDMGPYEGEPYYGI